MSTQYLTRWHQIWADGRIGFHRATPNVYLQKYAQLLCPQNILLPLCGKSLDMIWLEEQGWSVTGAELVQNAIEAFFSEQNGTPEKQNITHNAQQHPLYKHGNITIHNSNFFSLESEIIGTFDSIYDRAALVALEPTQRNPYIKHCFSLLKPKSTILLITYDLPRPAAQH